MHILQVEFSFPPLIEGNSVESHEIPEEWKNIPSLALPDGAHNYLKGIYSKFILRPLLVKISLEICNKSFISRNNARPSTIMSYIFVYFIL